MNPVLYLRGSHEELLNVQFIQKQGPTYTVNSHTDMGLAVRDFQKLLDVLNGTENSVNIVYVTETDRNIRFATAAQTSESDTTSTSSPMQSMKS